MAAELEIDIAIGPIRPIPVSGSVGAVPVIGGPCKLNGWNIRNSAGQTTVYNTVNALPAPASGVPVYSNNPFPVQVTVAGGTVSAIAVNGTTTGLTSGTFWVPANGTITVTFTGAPTTFTTAGVAPVSQVSGPGGPSATLDILSGSAPLGRLEVSVDASSQQSFGNDGIDCPGGVSINGLSGTWTGLIYASFEER